MTIYPTQMKQYPKEARWWAQGGFGATRTRIYDAIFHFDRRRALEYLAMTPEQKTWYLLTNPVPYMPDNFGPRNVKHKTGAMYEILARKWARQQLAEMS